MSAPPSDKDIPRYQPPHRFRQGRRGNDTPRGGSQRNSSHNNAREGNALQSQQNRRGGKQQQQNVNRPQQQQQAQQQDTGALNGPALPTDQHVPLNGFNAAEVEKFLAQGVEPRTLVYKPAPNSEGAKSGNPWGAKREFTIRQNREQG